MNHFKKLSDGYVRRLLYKSTGKIPTKETIDKYRIGLIELRKVKRIKNDYKKMKVMEELGIKNSVDTPDHRYLKERLGIDEYKALIALGTEEAPQKEFDFRLMKGLKIKYEPVPYYKNGIRYPSTEELIDLCKRDIEKINEEIKTVSGKDKNKLLVRRHSRQSQIEKYKSFLPNKEEEEKVVVEIEEEKKGMDIMEELKIVEARRTELLQQIEIFNNYLESLKFKI